MREKIACKTCRLRDKCNDLKPIVDRTPYVKADKGRPRMDICGEQLEEADNLLALICEEIEKVENPWNTFLLRFTGNFEGFEKARQKILARIKENG